MLGTVDAVLRDMIWDVFEAKILPAVREEIRAALTATPARALEENVLLSTKQAGAYVDVKPSTICSWIKKGKLPATRTPGGGPWRIRRQDLDRIRPPEKKPSADAPISPERQARDARGEPRRHARTRCREPCARGSSA